MRTGPIVVSAQRDDGTTSGASGSRPAASPIQDRLDIVRAIERSCSRLQIAINTVFRSLCIMRKARKFVQSKISFLQFKQCE